MLTFGTDGIRGKGNLFDNNFLERFASAIFKVFGKIKVGIARDTRLSGESIETILTKHLLNYGISVVTYGVIPTPTLAYMVKEDGLNLGIMISASHNPPEYNGLKLFSSQGAKVSTFIEKEIEKGLLSKLEPSNASKGVVEKGSVERYFKYLESIFGATLCGKKVVVDACYGATTTVLRGIFDRLGVNAKIINGQGDGSKINVDCGATCVEGLLKEKDCVCFAYDGDGDRVIAVKNGSIYTGDEIIYALTHYFRSRGEKIEQIVGTQTSNFALEKALKKQGVALFRSEVGDKNVFNLMKECGAIIGGESSGHVILGEYGETGDGILVSLFLMLLDKEYGLENLVDYTPYPVVEGYLLAKEEEKEVFSQSKVKEKIESIAVKNNVRVVVRASGTEDKIRLLVECENHSKGEEVYKNISDIVAQVIYEKTSNRDNKSDIMDTQSKAITKENYQRYKDNGVMILDESLTLIEEGVEIGGGSVIYPFTYLRAGTRIGENVRIYPFSDLEDTVVENGAEVRSTYSIGAVIGEGATVGPFATLRRGAIVGKGCRVGNYVEIKNATLGEKVKVAHLAYVGDASVGARTNVGCGTVFANYNGKVKRRTEVGENVFIGCNANLIAPLKIGDNAYIAGGATVREDVDENTFIITKSENERKERR